MGNDIKCNKEPSFSSTEHLTKVGVDEVEVYEIKEEVELVSVTHATLSIRSLAGTPIPLNVTSGYDSDSSSINLDLDNENNAFTEDSIQNSERLHMKPKDETVVPEILDKTQSCVSELTDLAFEKNINIDIEKAHNQSTCIESDSLENDDQIPDLDEIIINEHLLKKITASDLFKIEKNKDIVASTEVDKQLTDGQSENLALKLSAKHDVSMKDEKEFNLSSSVVKLYSVITDEKEKEKEEEPKHLTEKSSKVSVKEDTKDKEKEEEGENKDETKDLDNKEEAEDLAEISLEGEIEEKTPKYSEQVSSKDLNTKDKSLEGEIKDGIEDKEEEKKKDLTEKSSIEEIKEGDIKDETKDIKKEEEEKYLPEKSSEGDLNEEIPKSSKQVSVKDQ